MLYIVYLWRLLACIEKPFIFTVIFSLTWHPQVSTCLSGLSKPMATPTPSVWICDVLLPVPCTGFRATVCHVRPGAWAVRDFSHEYDHAFPSRTACSSRTTSTSDWWCCAITYSLFLSVIKQYIDVVFCGCFFCTWTWWIFFFRHWIRNQF